MSRLKALSLAVLLSLIAVQCVSSAAVTPQAAKGKAAGPSRADLADSKDSKTGEQQYPEEPYRGLQEVPDLIAHNPAYDIREPAKRPYGKQQPPHDEGPHSSYGRQGPPDRHEHADEHDDGPHQHAHEHLGKPPHGGPEEKPYEGPKEPYEESPCPKAMTADAVEDVLIGKASFVWKDLAEATSTRRGRNTRRGARRSSTDAETQDTQEADAVTDSTTDSTADAAAGASTVGTASTTGGTVEYRAALRAAAAAGMPSSTASRMRVANPEIAATLDADLATVHVAAAAAPAAADGANTAAGATAATPAGGADKAKPAYDKAEPGLADPEFLLPVGPEVSGKGEFGTYDGQMVPTGEALAVGPHVGPQANPTVATILHAVNAVAEIIFMSKKAGKMIARGHETQIKLSEIAKLVRPEVEGNLFMGDPSAFYDCKDERWVLTWTSYPDLEEKSTTPVTASLFVAVSHTIDPLESWTVYAFAARPMIAPGFRFCDAGGKSFSPLAPQTSYSDDGFFVSIGASCAAASDSATPGIMSTLFAFSKGRLYDVDSTSDEVYAATYMGAMSWKSSITYKEQSLIREDYRTFNNLITPARPQEPEDVAKPALFVMKVDGAYMSVATLTDEPLAKMDCTENAPKIRAIIIGKGEDFSNVDGMVDGTPMMPQPGTDIVLDSGDTGMLGGKFGIRTYGTVQNKGLLYTTMSEYFGIESVRVPSIYWAIVATYPGSGLCKAARKKWGFIASQDGLALAYPIVAAREDGSAIVVYSYSGDTEELPHSLGPAYPGVASSVVGRKEGYGYDQAPSIDIIKLGPAAIAQIDADAEGNPLTTDCSAHDCTARWGDYSASQVYGGHMWFAVPIAKELSATEDYRQAWRSWISVESLDDHEY